MATITATRCDCCGTPAEPATADVAGLDGVEGAEGVVLKKVNPTQFFCADGSKRVLPRGWWIFELTTFGDQHVVADLCDKCAKMFRSYIERKAKILAKRGGALLQQVSTEAKPKLLPPKKAKLASVTDITPKGKGR